MATFFDTGLAADVNMLHHSVRGHEEMSRTVDAAEVDILNEFTVRTSVNVYRVDLEGYNDETPASSHASLKAALKRAIAAVASHRLRNIDRRSDIQSEQLGDYKYDRGSGAGQLSLDWPTGWDNELSKFYAETAPLYTI